MLVRRDRLRLHRLLQLRHAILDGLLHLFEGAHFNLAHALARHTELGCKLLEGDRVVSQSSGLEYAPLALLEHVERGDQGLVPIIALLALGENALLARRLIDKPILPLAAFTIVAYRRIERRVAAEPTVHVDHVLLGDAKALGDRLYLFGPQVALIER